MVLELYTTVTDRQTFADVGRNPPIGGSGNNKRNSETDKAVVFKVVIAILV